MSGNYHPNLTPLPNPNFSYHQPSTYTGTGGSAPTDPGYSGGTYSPSGGYSPSPDSYLGDFNGPGNPNTEFNFNIGQLDNSNTTGNSGNTGGQGPNTSPGAAGGPQNYDFGNWTWEQILNEVLNLNIPDRNVIGGSNNRWTTNESDSSGDGGRLYIYGVTWGSDHQDMLTYLSTWLQTPGNPWDIFLNSPYQALYESETGKLAKYSTALAPDSFAGPIYALQGVEGFFANAAASLNAFANDLAGDQSAFQGQAGGAFAQLISDLWDQASQVSSQIGAPGAAGSYDQQLEAAMIAAETFLNSIWNAYADWSNIMEHSPLGAILQTLIAGKMVVGQPGNWTTSPNISPTDSPWGDLATDAAWQKLEAQAKALWLEIIGSQLDPYAQAALLNLTGAYYQAQNGLASVYTTPSPQILPPTPNYGTGGGSGPNISMPPINIGAPNITIPPFPNIPPYPMPNIPGFPNLGGPAFASTGPNVGGLPGGGSPGLYNWFNYLGDLGQANLNLAAAGFGAGGNGLASLANLTNSGFGGLGNLENSGLGGLANLENSSFGGLANLDNSGFGGIGNLANSGFGGLINGLGGIGGIGGAGAGLPTLGGQAASDLGNALASSDQTQAALRQALASGLVPAGGALSNDLQQALGSNGAVQSLLGQALSGGTPSITGLQTALADNAGTQAALEKALALAPRSGPLHNALEQALAKSRATEASIKGALASIGPAGESIKQALHSDGVLQSALRRAMLTGQIPASGPLHDSVQAAMAESAKLKNALDQAAAGGALPGHAAIARALSDNLLLQKDLNRALASGQVPSTGPLHADLERALAQSVKMGSELHQALAGHGIVAEPGIGVTLGDRALTGPLGPGQPLVTPTGGVAGLGGGALPGGVRVPGGVAVPGGGPLPGGVAVPGGGAIPGGGAAAAGLGAGGSLAGLGSSGQVSSGRFVPLTTGTASAAGAASELPLYPPMAGGMGMGMGMGQNGMGQERERTTWLAEDEDVWGADAQTGGPQVIGRDAGDDDDVADYDLDDAPERRPAGPDRYGARQRGHLR